MSRSKLPSKRSSSKGVRAPKVPTTCPQCGGKVVPIEYGNPLNDADLIARCERREALSGGCLMFDDSPDRGCVDCGASFLRGKPVGAGSKGWPNPWPN